MQIYKRKGTEVVVEAVKLDADNVDEIANWAQAQIVQERDALNNEPFEALNVWNNNGEHRYARCSRGMYVIKHEDNFYVSASITFEVLYEPVIG